MSAIGGCSTHACGGGSLGASLWTWVIPTSVARLAKLVSTAATWCPPWNSAASPVVNRRPVRNNRVFDLRWTDRRRAQVGDGHGQRVQRLGARHCQLQRPQAQR